jgi:CRISPR-associated protein Cas5d
MRWIVSSISVMKPIRYVSVRRNEVQSKISPSTVKGWMADPSKYEPLAAGAGANTEGTPRNSLLLRNVEYVIEAYPLVFARNGDNTPMKYAAMLQRRVEKGQCFQRPSFGCREFAVNFSLADPLDHPQPITEDLGRMVYDVIFRAEGNRAVFFDARLIDGVMDTRPEIALGDEQVREEVLRCSYRH